MKTLSIVFAGICLFATAHAQTPLPDASTSEVQLVIYVDLEPAQAAGGSSLLVKQLQAEGRDVGCRVAFLIKEDGRPNHFMIVERWSSIENLNAFRNSDPYRRFRNALQPMLASPLDERAGHQVAP